MNKKGIKSEKLATHNPQSKMKHTLAVGSAVDAATVSALCSTAGCSTLTECFGESVMLPAASVATAGEGTFR